jgi:Domain of unknown function (DUF4129)
MSAFPYTPATVADLRHKLDAILASGDFPQAKPPGLWQRIWDEFLRWFFKILTTVMPGTPSHTTLLALEFMVIALPCGLLVWWFVRRLRLQGLDLPQEGAPHPSAPSSLDWQTWLQQGQELGQAARWREAIHHVYWSSISCLESRGLWPADRARTPREYLTLVEGKPVRTDLLSLTRSFERTWYGDQPASEKQFDEACRELERIAAL